MSKTILTIDDSRTMRDMLRLALTAAGHSVIQADDGVNGLAALAAAGQVDVIITDINMPRMDGYGFIEHVRQGNFNRVTPILVLTTESEPARKLRARQAGATGWIVKPFDSGKLLAAIHRVSP